MGFSTLDCKHCNHPVLDPRATDEGINEWMEEGVLMTADGSRLMGKLNGEAHTLGDFDISMAGGVMAHKVCWELNGRPDYEAYEKDSRFSEDQGWFFDDGAHDLIDPRITDEAERARLLAEGVARRTQRRYNERARQVAEMLDKEEREYHRELHGEQMWKLRFSASNDFLLDDKGEIVRDRRGRAKEDPNKWHFYDKLSLENELKFEGTEDEMNAHMSAKWAAWIESEEVAGYIARAKEIREEAEREYIEKLKEEGRFEVSYRPSKIPGDSVVNTPDEARPWKGGRSVYTVRDRFLYKEVAEMEGPWEALGTKTFVRDPDYDGNNSAEWEARVEDIRAAGGESARLAKEEAQRLNDQWKADGYPIPEERF